MGAIHAHQGLLLSSGGNATAIAIYNKIVAWWDHSGTSGAELLDSHTGGYDESPSSSTYSAGQTAIAAGLGTCIHTNVSTRLDASHATALDLNNDFSIMHWFSRDTASQPAFPKLIAKYTDAPNGKMTYGLQIQTSTNKLTFRFNNGGSYYDATGSTSLSDNTAYMAIGTKLATGSELYLNNSLDGTQASGGTPDTAIDPVRNGASAATSNDCMIGKFSAAALFTPALTSTERSYLWNGGSGMSYATLKAAAGH